MDAERTGDGSWLDERADRFERAWAAGGRPRIEDHLGDAAGPRREPLLRELLRVERQLRVAAGEAPDAGEYRRRFPGDGPAVAAAFAAAGPADPGGTPADAADPGRNLLFGLLALQNSFIDRRALVAAFDAWTTDRSRTLGSHLARRGAISAELRALIDGLVAAHLARHGGEPDRSLAALTPIGPVRDELRAVADPDALASLSRVPAGRGDDDPDATAIGSVGGSTSDGVRFRVLRPLGGGGMGVVSVALDTELDRTVALKEIRGSAADDGGYRARFLAEAEITGKLEHPGIIPIYGLGTYADGRPFYAMRLIRGEKTGTLMDAVARFHARPDAAGRVVEFRGLLGRFLDVCNAVAYAHSKGVLHRDLKPQNILLGPYGETLVVDWGLAKAAGGTDPADPAAEDRVRLKLSGGGSGPTLAGDAVGTPGYAPPEQLTGDLARVGPRSDVYGLGAVLYCLMTGRAPVSRRDFELGELIRKVEAGDFPPPRRVRAGLDRALEAICLKALALRPEDRYESARALAADVERHLAEEPVSAYREPRGVRARRWARRHRTAATATVAALAVAVAGLGAVAAVQVAANRSLDGQRRRAEDRERLAIDAVRRFRDAVAEEPTLKDTPALEGLRRRLLKEPLSFFRGLRDSMQADGDTRPESLARLAQASLDLGMLNDEIGDKQSALIAYLESLAIRRKLADDEPAVTEFRRGLATSYYHVGVQMMITGKTAEALKSHETARAIQQALAENYPDATAFRADLARSQNSIGDLLMETGRPADALKALESARAIRQDLAEIHPAVTTFRADLADSYNSIGNLLAITSRPAEALKAHESARVIQQVLVDAVPNAIASQTKLARTHNSIGGLLNYAGESVAALKAFETSRTISQGLADVNPAVIQIQRNLAASHNYIGKFLLAHGKPAEALKALESARAIQQKLADDNPSVTAFKLEQSYGHNSIGELLRAIDRPSEALKAYESARAIQQKLAEADPDVISFRTQLAYSHNCIGSLLKGAGRPAEALRAHESARAIQQGLVKSDPDAAIFRALLADSLCSIGDLLRVTGKPAEALETYQSARAILRKLVDDHPALANYQDLLATCLVGIGRGLRATGKPAEALETYQSARAILRKLADDHPNETYHKALLAYCLDNVGDSLDAAGRPTEALEAYESERAILRKLADDYPAVTGYQDSLASCLVGIGRGLRTTGRPAEALEAYESERAILRKLADDHPAVTGYQDLLAISHINIGQMLRATGRPAEALEAYESERAILRKLADNHPDNTDHKVALARVHDHIGLVLRGNGMIAEALESYESARSIWQELARGNSPGFTGRLGETLSCMAVIDLDAGRFGEARGRLRQAVRSLREAGAPDPSNSSYYRRLLACDLSNLIRASRGTGEPEGVVEAERELEALGDEGFNLGFEKSGDIPTRPKAWAIGNDNSMTDAPGYRVMLDEHEARSGKRSLRADSTGKGSYVAAFLTIPGRFAAGKRVKISGWIRTKDVAARGYAEHLYGRGGYAGLLYRVDGPAGRLALDNMVVRVDGKGKVTRDDRGVRGTTDWRLYSVELDVPSSAENVVFGGLLTGTGTAWWDDFAVEIAGQPFLGKSPAGRPAGMGP